MYMLGYDGKPISKGDRIVLHPNCNLFKLGKVGTVLECRRDLVSIQLDGNSKIYNTVPHNMRRINITTKNKPKTVNKKVRRKVIDIDAL